MNYSTIRDAARLLLLGSILVFSLGTSAGAEFWLRAGTTIKTMPDGRQVTMWGFARDSAAGAGDGVITVPGPQLDIAAGDGLIIHLQNTLPEAVSIVIPGQYGYDSLDAAFHSGDAYDGRMRSFTREAAAAGGTATYSWTNVQAGTFLYHSGTHPSVQVHMGLYGAVAVTASGQQVYPGIPFSTAVTLLFSEIDPDVHDAVAAGSFGPGPGFLADNFTDATAAAWIAAINGSSNPLAQFISGQLVSGNTATGLVADLNTIVGGSSIYDPALYPDSILSATTLAWLKTYPELNQPTETVPFNGAMVRLNRLLLQDGLAAAGLPALPLVKAMTSTIRSHAQYFLINGQPYTSVSIPISGGNAGATTLLRMLNAGMDAHIPTLNNGGDFKLVGEDGQQAPNGGRNASVVFMPALKTLDAIWTPPAAGTYALYDRRLGLVNAIQSPGGMLVYLSVGAAASAAPAILVQPTNQTVPELGTAAFQVVASGTGLTYQWQRNGVPIAGATAATYSRANVSSATDNGTSFSVVVSGTGGPSVTSSAATLTVTTAAPTITTQPASHNVTPPAATTFTVVAAGSTPLTYQWAVAPSASGPFVPLVNGSGISGATLATLSLAPTSAASAGFYQVTVTGPGGTVSSAAAELRVAPAITTQPASTTVADLATASFSVTATGSSLTYQWQRRPGASGSFTNIPGATASTYSFTSHRTTDNGAQFRVVVSGSGGPNVTSNNATLTVSIVNSAPAISTQPSSVNANGGDAQVTFTVVAYGFPAPTYRWQRFNGTTWVNLNNSGGFSGTTTATLTVASGSPTITVAHAGSYRVVITNSQGSATSSVAPLTVTQTFLGIGAILPQSGSGIPYPSTSASVPAFTGASVTHVKVSINILTHQEPYDLCALLVGPGTNATARRSEFAAFLGAIPNETAGYAVTGVSLTFDDNAAAQVSSLYPIATGTYQPTAAFNAASPQTAFPGSAPGLPYPTTLSTFNGYVQTAAGGWRLYLRDAPWDVFPGRTSPRVITNWSLTLTVGP